MTSGIAAALVAIAVALLVLPRRHGESGPDMRPTRRGESSLRGRRTGSSTVGAVLDEPVVVTRDERLRRAMPALLGLGVWGVSVGLLGVVIGSIIGAVLGPIAGVWLSRSDLGRPRPPGLRTVPLTLDIVAAALLAGRPLADALVAGAPAAAPAIRAPFERVAGLLRLGAPAREAWPVAVTATGGALAPVAEVAIRSAESGLRLATSFQRLAADMRSDEAGRARARGARAGVLSMLPLGLCFLPSFVCLGIVPLVVGIAGGVLGLQ